MSVPPEIEASCTSGLIACIDVVEALRHQRRAGRQDRAQTARQVVAFAPARSPAFLQASMYLALVPNTSTRSRSAMSQSIVGPGMERRAVEQDQRLPDREPADQPVPHHPAAGGEVEHALAGPRVGVQAVLLDVLQQRAAGAVHDRLGHAGRARGIEDVERMVERQLGELERRRVGLPVVRRTAIAMPRHRLAASRNGTSTVRSEAGSAVRASRRTLSPDVDRACRRSGSRRPRSAPWARSGRSGRARRRRRNRARTRTRSRPARSSPASR